MNPLKTTRFICTLILLAICSLALAEDPVDFADPALKAAVMEALGLTTDPTPSNMLRLTAMMNASHRGITDLTGLEYAVNLEQVDLGVNQVEDISILAGLTRLREVGLSWNRIADISVLGGLTELTYLDVGVNQITDIGPLAGLAKLRVLYLNSNEIGSLAPLAGLTNIENLSVVGTSISDLSPLVGLTHLRALHADDNSIQDVSPLADLKDLTVLRLYDNQIADISPLAGLTGLTWLGLRNNRLTDIQPLAGLVNLDRLDLNGNQIQDISALAGMSNLEHLYLWQNEIMDITALAGLVNLTNLSISENPVTDIAALSDLTELVYLGMYSTHVADISLLSSLTNLVYLEAAGNGIRDISPLAGLTALERLELQGNQIEDCRPVAELTRLTYLNIGSNRISDLSCLSGLTKLEFLFLFDNRVVDLTPLSGLTSLLCLNCDWNQIVDISPLSTLTSLTSLTLNSNRVSDITAMAALTSLQHLDLDNNNLIEDISSLAGLTGLTSLNLGRNAIADISALTGMTRLAELWLSGNPLHPRACVVDIPLIRANNPGIVIHQDGCVELRHRWSFNGDLRDSVGGRDAVIVDLGMNDAILSDTEITLIGGEKHTSDYIDLSDGIVSRLGDSVTFEAWATQLSVQNWSRIFDFGTSVSENVFMSWTNGTNLNVDRVEWLGPRDSNTMDNTNAPYTLGVEFHIVCVIDNGLVTWYTGPADSRDLGVAKGSFQSNNRLSELNDNNCWLGRSQWEDSTANASWNEVRLWKGALTSEEIEILHDRGPDGVGRDIPVEVSQTLTVSSTDGGAVTVPGEGEFIYPVCSEVQVVAEAENDHYFVGWTGSAVDSGLVADPSAASTKVTVCQSVSLVAEFAPACIVVFDFPLDSDPGWARSGQWEFGVPTGQRCGAWGNSDPTGGHTGSNVFGVNLNGCYDPAAGPLYSLLAGPFDLSIYGDVELRFWRWLNADWREYVRSSVEVSTDAVTWDTLWEHLAHGGIIDLDWTLCTYRVPQAHCQPTVYIRWSYQVVRPLAYSYTGWNIDDIQLTGCLGCDR